MRFKQGTSSKLNTQVSCPMSGMDLCQFTTAAGIIILSLFHYYFNDILMIMLKVCNCFSRLGVTYEWRIIQLSFDDTFASKVLRLIKVHLMISITLHLRLSSGKTE